MLLQKNQFTTVWSVTFLALGDDTLNNNSEMLKNCSESFDKCPEYCAQWTSILGELPADTL